MTKPSLEPRQARSRESETKLIKATVNILRQYGLEGATIPRVAEQAGLTPGAVYRRFPDKNALLERCILRILEDQLKHLEQTLTQQVTAKIKLPALIEEIVRANLAGLRTNAKMLHALRQFVRNSDHRAFKRKATELEKSASAYLLNLLMAYQKQIRHPDPKAALSMAFLALNTTLMELFAEDDTLKHLQDFMPTDDESLVRELKRMFLSYIGAT
jgi:AcrR family transcriptional regulator